MNGLVCKLVILQGIPAKFIHPFHKVMSITYFIFN